MTYDTIYTKKATTHCTDTRKHPAYLKYSYLWLLLTAILLTFGVMLGSSLLASSRSNAAGKDDILYKYYTSIQIQPGDTLWSLSEQYAVASKISQNDYVDELISMNHLSDTTIHTGDYLTISYYSYELK